MTTSSSYNQVQINKLELQCAKEFDVDTIDVDRIVSDIFGFTAKLMSEKKDNVIYLRYLGTFGGKLSRSNQIEKVKKNKDGKI